MEQIMAFFKNLADQLLDMLMGLGLDESVITPIKNFFDGIFAPAA